MYRSSDVVTMNKSRILRWTGHLAKIEDSWDASKILTSKPIAEIRLGRPRHAWAENNRKYFKGIHVNTRKWIVSANDNDYWRLLVRIASNLRSMKPRD